MYILSLLCLALTLFEAQTSPEPSTDYSTFMQQLAVFKGFTFKMSQTLSFIKEGISKEHIKDYAINELQAIEMDANETQKKALTIYELAQHKSNFNVIQLSNVWVGVKEISLECLKIKIQINVLLGRATTSQVNSTIPSIPILQPIVIPALDKSQPPKKLKDYMKMYEKVEDELVQIVDELINFCRVNIKPNIKDYSDEETEELIEMLSGIKGVEQDLSEVIGEIEDSDDLSSSDEIQLNKIRLNLLGNLQTKRRMVYSLIHYRSGRYQLMQQIISINPVGSLLH